MERRDEVVRLAFREAVDLLSARYGPRMKDWSWEKAAPFILSHAFGGSIATAHLDRGPFPTAGTSNSVNMHRYSRTDATRFPVLYGPALRLVVDFNDMGRSFMSIPGGQSGRPSSKHYDDILPLYLKGEGVSLDMDVARIEGEARLHVTLTPER